MPGCSGPFTFFFPCWRVLNLSPGNSRQCVKGRAHLRWDLYVRRLCTRALERLSSADLLLWCRWEFVTTLEFEWEVYTGRRPWRWSFIVYVAARVLGLACIVLSLVGFSITREFNCDVGQLFVCRKIGRTLTPPPSLSPTQAWLRSLLVRPSYFRTVLRCD